MSTERGAIEPQIVEYLRIVRRRRWWIVGATVLALVAAGGFSFASGKKYTATATMLIQPNPPLSQGGNGNSSNQNVSPQQIQTDQQLLSSRPVKIAVAKALHEAKAPTVTTGSSLTSNIVSVSDTDASPARAALVANAFATAFATYARSVTLAADTVVANNDSAQLVSVQNAVAALEATLPANHAQSPKVEATETQISGLVNEETNLRAELLQATVAEQQATGGVTIASSATPPTGPSSPKTVRNLALGAVAGLILGLLLAFLIDNFDDSLRSKEDLERAYPKLPLLGLIPFVDAWKTPKRPYVVSLAAPLSPATESYRSLRTAMQFLRLDRDIRSVVVTSSIAGEGKTSTVANLAIAFAKSGHQVCVVSADLRRPRLGEFLGLSDDVGLTSVALGTASLDEALQRVPDVQGLRYLGTGPLPAESSEFLSAPRTEDIFTSLRDRFDLVLIDTPPLLPVTDGLVLGHYTGGVVLVTQQGVTRRRSLQRVREICQQSNLEMLGAVMTEAAGRGYDRYQGYGQYRGYAAKDPVHVDLTRSVESA